METSISFFLFCGVSRGFHCLSFYFSWSIVTDENTWQGIYLYRAHSVGFCPMSLSCALLRATLGHKLSHLSLKCAILNLLFNSLNYYAKSYFMAETHGELQGFEILSN